jgi:hypothetical protein
MSTCVKTLTKVLWNSEQKKLMMHKEVRTYNYDPIAQHRLGKQPINTKTSWYDFENLPEDIKPKKEIKVPIILLRTATNYETYETISAYFLTHLTVKVLSDAIYKHIYLTTCEGRIFVHYLATGETFPIAMTGENTGIIKTFSTELRKLTTDEYENYLEQKINVYEKVGTEYRILI